MKFSLPRSVSFHHVVAWAPCCGCGSLPLSPEISQLGVTDEDWEQTQKILKRAECKSETAMFTFAFLWTSVVATVSFVFELHGLWGLLSFVGLAPVFRAFFYPAAVEELNEIYNKKFLQVAWVQSMCSTGLAFMKKKGNFLGP
mmetsp:Transcript_71183/g.112764  ORF Transcript_71183/g.112764 Transcript_71183/m.112764 type:complete len:143 (+) Transcript_71183:60-488(+)